MESNLQQFIDVLDHIKSLGHRVNNAFYNLKIKTINNEDITDEEAISGTPLILCRTANIKEINFHLSLITDDGFEHRQQCNSGWYETPSASWVFKYNSIGYVVVIHNDEVISGHVV